MRTQSRVLILGFRFPGSCEALNLYELGEFKTEGRRVAVDDLVTRYNEIVEGVETDPSLKIKIRK